MNGGFEERVPRTAIGRVFGVMLVLSSLFIVSIFVAKITAVMTVEAISGSVTSVNDLYGKRTGTIEGSHSGELFCNGADIDYRGFENLDDLLAAFEVGDIRVVVFDAPVLKLLCFSKAAVSTGALLVPPSCVNTTALPSHRGLN